MNEGTKEAARSFGRDKSEWAPASSSGGEQREGGGLRNMERGGAEGQV